MKTFVYISALCLGFSFGVYAQTAEQDTADQQEQPAQETDDGVQQQAPDAMPDIGLIEEENVIIENDENFVPSVRITEDLPVAFPVDI